MARRRDRLPLATTTPAKRTRPHSRRAPRADEEARTPSIYLVDGRLTSIPARRKQIITILEALVTAFDYDRRYPEAEVTAILARHQEDVATLRRELVGHRLLARERGVYWRAGDRVGAATADATTP